AAPAQRVVDFLTGQSSTDLPRSSYPLGVTPSDLHEVLPPSITGPMKDALRDFDRKLAGFAGPQAILIAPETRTTSPIRFERTEDLQSTTLPGLYPIGEGAGYAGGIISSALDGLRAARAIAAGLPLQSCG
ncbi:MAG: FAD-dependent protein, partial [Myxococcota bacterium]